MPLERLTELHWTPSTRVQKSPQWMVRTFESSRVGAAAAAPPTIKPLIEEPKLAPSRSLGLCGGIGRFLWLLRGRLIVVSVVPVQRKGGANCCCCLRVSRIRTSLVLTAVRTTRTRNSYDSYYCMRSDIIPVRQYRHIRYFIPWPLVFITKLQLRTTRTTAVSRLCLSARAGARDRGKRQVRVTQCQDKTSTPYGSLTHTLSLQWKDHTAALQTPVHPPARSRHVRRSGSQRGHQSSACCHAGTHCAPSPRSPSS